jgi:hypothetical protein
MTSFYVLGVLHALCVEWFCYFFSAEQTKTSRNVAIYGFR